MNDNNQETNPVTPLAVTNWRDIRKRFGIKAKNRRGHMYIIGKTGTGKSTLLKNMVISDIRQGNGLAVLDPHGDLVEDILHSIPQNRIDDVIYFNPADLEYPIAFNPLESVNPDMRFLIASNLISVFKKIWAEFWGPRLEHILRHSLLTLLEYPNSTLLDLPKLLTDKEYRQQVLVKVSHPQVQEFWVSEFDKYSAWLRSEAISPILNKIGQFLISIPLRNIVGQPKNTFNFRNLMDTGKILLVNLAKGRLGEDNCSLLGSIIITQLQLAAMSRAEIPENQRRPFYLYVDEIHNFLTLSFADILSESRKYGLNLTLCNQFILQLEEKISAAIFGNVGTIISFRIGAEDAEYLAREFHPVFNETDLVNLPNYHIYLKLLIDGVTSDAFSAVTLPAPERMTSYKEAIIQQSREKYCRPRKQVEKAMLFNRARETKPRTKQASLFT